MKNLTQDTEGFLPLIGIAAIGIASWLGYSWLTEGTEDFSTMLKAYAVASLLFIFGIIALMGKFGSLGKLISFIIGISCVGFAGYIVYLGYIPFV